MTALRRSASGFTLVELLIAVFVFAVLSGLGYVGLSSVIEQRRTAGEALTRTTELRATAARLREDLFTVRHRPVADAFGSRLRNALIVPGEAASSTLPVLEFTRGGWRNPALYARGSQQRVAWLVEDGALVRASWAVLDPAPDSEPLRRVMLEGVLRVRVRLLTGDGLWEPVWPPRDEPAGIELLPRAAEITVETEDLGELVWLVEMVGA